MTLVKKQLYYIQLTISEFIYITELLIQLILNILKLQIFYSYTYDRGYLSGVMFSYLSYLDIFLFKQNLFLFIGKIFLHLSFADNAYAFCGSNIYNKQHVLVFPIMLR